VEGVGGRTPTLTKSTEDMSISAVRIERGVNSLVKGAIPQMLTKECKHPLCPFLLKRDIGKLPIQGPTTHIRANSAPIEPSRQ